ncbi:MAG: enoyl-CoA hydratase/isomerase family protein [Burkholderiales bacterium]
MIDLHIVSGIYFVTFTNPATRNALNEKIMAGLEAALDAASGDAFARAVVLRGPQGSFCSGGDFAQFKAMVTEVKVEPEPNPVAQRNRNFGRLLEKMIAFDVPLLALVEGAAMAAASDLRQHVTWCLPLRAQNLPCRKPPSVYPPRRLRRLSRCTSVSVLRDA